MTEPDFLTQARFALSSRSYLMKEVFDETCLRQQRIIKEAATAWSRFLPWFKQRCREFCSRVDPHFEPLLQKLLLSEDWTFPKWEEVFFGFAGQGYYNSQGKIWNIYCYRDDYFGDKTIFVLSKIVILSDPEKYVRTLFTQAYALYQKLPRGASQGMFDATVTWSDLYEYIHDAVEMAWNGCYFNFYTLYRQIQQNQVFHKNKTYYRPDLILEEKICYF